MYRAIDMSLCGILGWKSALQGGSPVDVPDFREESVRKQYETDHFSPDPTRENSVPRTIYGPEEPLPQGVEFAKQIWNEQGYPGE